VDKVVYMCILAKSPGVITLREFKELTGCYRDSVGRSVRRLKSNNLIKVTRKGQYNYFESVGLT
jgi:DNA-binding transcriptional regulator GbsR (MarR family)